MFTGIVECLGTVTGAQRRGGSIVLSIRPDAKDFGVAIGASVAVDGVCLTLEQHEGSALRFSAVDETLRRTTLQHAVVGSRVNLERAALLGGRLDGHLVYGHVDGVGTIHNDLEKDGSTVRTFAVTAALMRYFAVKGSVAVDGISLTIVACSNTTVSVSLVPHTLKTTTMSLKHPGDRVNVECDIIARYVEQMAAKTMSSSAHAGESLLSVMEKAGF